MAQCLPALLLLGALHELLGLLADGLGHVRSTDDALHVPGVEPRDQGQGDADGGARVAHQVLRPPRTASSTPCGVPIWRRISSETFFMAAKGLDLGLGEARAAEHGRGHEPVGVADQDRALLAGALEGGDELLRGVQAVELLDRADLLRLLALLVGEVADHGLVLGHEDVGRRARSRARARARAAPAAGGGGGGGGAASRSCPIWKVSRSSRRRRFWSLLRCGVRLERLEERRAAQEARLVDDHELRQLLGQPAARRLDVSSGRRRVLEHDLAQLALGAVGDGPGEDTGRRLPALQDRQQLGGREAGEGLVGRLPHLLVGVADEVGPQLDEVLGLEGKRAPARP